MHLPPQLALLLTLGLIAFLFYRENRGGQHVTAALWMPVIWLTIIGSRFVSQWLDIFGFHMGAVNLEDGSPVDAFFFGLLILSGLCVLYQRRVSLGGVLRNNRWMTIFLVYCFLAIFWSDFPLVAFKRWLKVIGHPVMVLVVLTEPDPEEAIIRLLKRCSYVWVPISILWIKYFPALGRGFSQWTGAAENCGIAANKNMLGLDLFIVGAFFVWYFLRIWRQEGSTERRDELILAVFFTGAIAWLLRMAQSSTSLVSVLIATTLVLVLGFRWVNPRYIGAWLVTALIVGAVAEGFFGIYSGILHLLGKSSNLSDRTQVWHDVLQIKINPILGAGYESFWLGDRLKILWAKWWWHPNEAHNCYLETYLNLGLIGLALLLGWFFATYRKARRDLMDGLDWGQFRLAFLVATLFYDWTEAPFKAVDPVYFIFFLIAIDYPRPEVAAACDPIETVTETTGAEAVSANARMQWMRTQFVAI